MKKSTLFPVLEKNYIGKFFPVLINAIYNKEILYF